MLPIMATRVAGKSRDTATAAWRISGATLLELLLAGVFATVAAVALSAVFPKASKTIVSNQQRWVATNLASAQIKKLQSRPYAYVDATAASQISAASCDCRADDFSFLPSTSTQAAGTTFTLKSCVHFVTRVGTAWPSQCAPDSGYKNILVRVFWTNGTKTYSTTAEATKTRY